MDDKEKQLFGEVQALLPPITLKNFVMNFKELLGKAPVNKWDIKLLKLFELFADNDTLIKRIFMFFESANLSLPYEFYFASKAYKLFDYTNYVYFLDLMSEYVDARNTSEHKQSIGRRLMEIVREEADIIFRDDSPHEAGESVKFHAFRKFQFWFEMFLTLDGSKYTCLDSLVVDYIRARSNEDRIECVRKIVMEVFGLDKYLTKKFLDLFAPGRVSSLDSFLISVRHHSQLQNSLTSDHPSQLSTATVEQRYPVLDPRIQDQSTTEPDAALIEPNSQILNTQLPDLQAFVTEGPIGESYSFFDIRTLEMLTPMQHKYPDLSSQSNAISSMVTAVPTENKCLDQEARTVDYQIAGPSATQIKTLAENPSPIESTLSDLGFWDPDYLVWMDTRITNNSIDLSSLISSTAPAEPQCPDQEARTADTAITVPATPIKSPTKNPSPVQSNLPDLGSSVADDLPASTELFDEGTKDYSPSDITEQFEMLDSHASVSPPSVSNIIDQNKPCDSGLA